MSHRKDGQFLVGYDRTVTRDDYLALTGALGFGDDESEPAAHPSELLDPLGDLLTRAQEHDDCPVWCDGCDQWEKPLSCAACHGSGCSPLTALGAFDPCPECSGEGRDHKPYTPTGSWQHQPLTVANEGGPR